MKKTFPLAIFSLDREVFAGESAALTVPGKSGELQVLANHIPFVTALKEGDLVIEDKNGGKKTIPVAGGVLEVKKDEVVVLATF